MSAQPRSRLDLTCLDLTSLSHSRSTALLDPCSPYATLATATGAFQQTIRERSNRKQALVNIMADPPPKNPGGLSLYRELLAPKEGSVISAAPVRYDTKANEPEAEVQKKNNGRVANYLARSLAV